MQRVAVLMAFWVLILGLEAAVVVGSQAELEKAVAEAVPGQVIKIRDGIYEDCQLVLAVSGTPDKKCVLQALNPGKVTFKGDSGLTFNGDHWVIRDLFFFDVIYRRITRRPWRPYPVSIIRRLRPGMLLAPFIQERQRAGLRSLIGSGQRRTVC